MLKAIHYSGETFVKQIIDVRYDRSGWAGWSRTSRQNLMTRTALSPPAWGRGWSLKRNGKNLKAPNQGKWGVLIQRRLSPLLLIPHIRSAQNVNPLLESRVFMTSCSVSLEEAALSCHGAGAEGAGRGARQWESRGVRVSVCEKVCLCTCLWESVWISFNTFSIMRCDYPLTNILYCEMWLYFNNTYLVLWDVIILYQQIFGIMKCD